LAELNLPRILIVDDEALVLEALRRQLRTHFDVTVANEPWEAMELVASKGPYAVVVSDLRMPGMDGVTLLYRQAASTLPSSSICRSMFSLTCTSCRPTP